MMKKISKIKFKKKSKWMGNEKDICVICVIFGQATNEAEGLIMIFQ